MLKSIYTFLTQPDLIVLNKLSRDIQNSNRSQSLLLPEVPRKTCQMTKQPYSFSAVSMMRPVKPSSLQSLQIGTRKISPRLSTDFSYNRNARWAKHIIRRPTDVVFLTHILIYLATSVPSALYLYYNYSWRHAIFHWIMQGLYCGSSALMFHNHIHNNGVLTSKHAWSDTTWPYILEPLMGHTWDSYYCHPVKHHHVENNGREDFS